MAEVHLSLSTSHEYCLSPLIFAFIDCFRCRSIETVLEEFHSGAESSFSRLEELLGDCIRTFMDSDLYQDDVRFLKIWILYADVTQDVEKVYLEMEDKQIGISHSLLYEAFAFLMESKGDLVEALSFYQLGISRKAEPLERLKKMHKLFLNRISDFVDSCSNKNQKSYINPWATSTIQDILQKIDKNILKYDVRYLKGFHRSLKKYAGKVPLNSLHTSSRNKVIELGGRKYQIKGCSGQGAFARVYKAFENSNPDDVVALKDAINSYLVTGHCMEEELCIYYTLEMLHMLETLHSVGIIHGDFKPDNLLVRYARGDLTEEEFIGRKGAWHDQVDTYCLCVITHMMLHGTYMEIEKKPSSDGSYHYQPKSSLKRYWKVDLWKNLFSTLLNSSSHGNNPVVLQSLRETFEDHVCGDSQMIRKLKQLLVKQRASLCSS
ncbi:hypothetical protein QJS04_geneDACA012250 [Acorus gramineus]|uniref:BUB1 N-terminal domain-containing protein n=1 Tax=Acorus gramineus TaxID=55184 RepID=A0AAV9B7L1_ACOGR|nr:hypothetical protein QJS04_geneDACA012250 [Acorus gramineus]